MKCALRWTAGCLNEATHKVSITTRVPVGSGSIGALSIPSSYEICDAHDEKALFSVNSELYERAVVVRP